MLGLSIVHFDCLLIIIFNFILNILESFIFNIPFRKATIHYAKKKTNKQKNNRQFQNFI